MALVLTPSQFRKFFVGLVLLSVLFGAAVYQYNERSGQRAVSVIPIEDVGLEKLVLDTSFGTYLKGSLRNNSKAHVLRQAEVRIKVHDCPAPEVTSDCLLLSTQTVSLYGPVPPGAAKPFSTNIVVPSAREKYPLVTYEILATKGK